MSIQDNVDQLISDIKNKKEITMKEKEVFINRSNKIFQNDPKLAKLVQQDIMRLGDAFRNN